MQPDVQLSRLAEKQLKRTPAYIRVKLARWIAQVLSHGLAQVRQQPGYHDEPLKGKRKGQRSIRLNKQWRAIYTEDARGDLHLITIEEVNPHDY